MFNDERDLVGYANNYPQVHWPQQSRIALNFVLNYEEGAELNIINGDSEAESYLTDLPGIVVVPNQRHLSSESMFEFGSRVGVWRILNLFAEYQIPITIFATGLALERNVAVADFLANSIHEIAGHGYRWINYRDMAEVEEKVHIQKTLDVIRKMCKRKPLGWYTGRKSVNTRRLIVESGLLYDSDSYNDELPYWTKCLNRSHLVIPYALDTNDVRYVTTPGFSTGNDFFIYLKNTFDCLYREGRTNAKMMTVGLHARLSGRPGRCEGLKMFLDYVNQYDKVWICRRLDIAQHWVQNHAYI